MHTSATLYDQDFCAWTQHQASLLRAEKWQDLDYANLAEEVESWGRSEKRECGHRLEVLIMHLLKWHHQPAGRPHSHSWADTI